MGSPNAKAQLRLQLGFRDGLRAGDAPRLLFFNAFVGLYRLYDQISRRLNIGGSHSVAAG
jgi:hypothetical protein